MAASERQVPPPAHQEEIAGQNQCTLEEAIAYMAVTPQEFNSLLKQYGVGRYHVSRDHDQFVYSMDDLDRIKRGRAAQG